MREADDDRFRRAQTVINALLFPHTFVIHGAALLGVGVVVHHLRHAGVGFLGTALHAAETTLLVLGAWLLAMSAEVWWHRRRPPSDSGRGRAVLVTGCDSGFGAAAARELHACGFAVFAGAFMSGFGFPLG